MSNPLISVIVPVYNTEEYVEKAIRSIMEQTYKNIEILVVDDGSTDKSGEICDRLAEEDDRVRVFHKENGGQATARNFALSVARGEYIGYVDSDDWIAENMYDGMLHTLIDNDCDVCVCGRYAVTEEDIRPSFGSRVESVTVMDKAEAIRRFLVYDSVDSSVWDKLFKRSVIENVTFPAGYICEDIPFVYDALVNADRVVHCAKSYYYWLHRQGSTSRSTFSKKGMGLYIYPLEVRDRAKEDFPTLTAEADYFYLKNLLVTAYRISAVKGKVEERKEINREVRRNFSAILRCGRLKKSYKLFSCLVFLRIERPVKAFGGLLGIKKAGI